MTQDLDPLKLSSPRIFLIRMVVFLILCSLIVVVLNKQMLVAFMANPGLNALIIGVLLIGIALAFRQVIRLFPEVNWVNSFRLADPGLALERPPVLLAPMAAMLGDRMGRMAISSQIMSNLADLSEAVDWYPTNLIIDRFGLNYDFIEVNNLSWIDNLETSSGGRLDDPRHKDHLKPYVQDYLRKFGVRKVEANALVVRPVEGRRLCRDAIRRYVPENALLNYRAALDVERRKVKEEIASLLRAEAAE